MSEGFPTAEVGMATADPSILPARCAASSGKVRSIECEPTHQDRQGELAKHSPPLPLLSNVVAFSVAYPSRIRRMTQKASLHQAAEMRPPGLQFQLMAGECAS